MKAKTEEEIQKHKELVAERQCIMCAHFMPLSSFHCSHCCDYDKNGWELADAFKDTPKKQYNLVKEKKPEYFKIN